MHLHTVSALAAALAMGAIHAQSPADGQGPSPRPAQDQRVAKPTQEVVTPTAPQSAVADDFVTPIHTAPDDPEGGAYGIWGAGGNYKVSFHDGFTFVPYLGRNYPNNQPWSWRTVSVSRSGRPVVELQAEPTRNQSDYRYEYQHGSFVEAYDVRLEGAEQTFTFQQPLGGSGDLVVLGQVTTALRAATVDDRVDELSFADAEGRRIIRYGRALAFDARDRRIDVPVTFDGQNLSLRLDGEWLDRATYPVTIDPLLTRESVAFWNTLPVTADGTVTGTAVGRDDDRNQPCIAYTRSVSATDSDLWVWLFDSDTALRSERHQIFTDITTSWGDESVNIATVGGAAGNESWIIAFVRPFPAASRGPRFHVHAIGDTTLTTTFNSVPRPGGTKVETIDVGGRNTFDSSDVCMFVYDRNLDSGADNLAVFGITWSVTGGFGTETALSQGSWPQATHANQCPKINQVADQSGSDGWMVVWQSYRTNFAGDDWDVVGRRVTEAGAIDGAAWATLRSIPDDRHQLAPDVAGQGGKYAVSYAEWQESPQTQTTSKLGGEIYVDRLDWPSGGAQTRVSTCEITVGFVADRRWSNDSLNFDDNSRSHWCAMLTSTVSGTQYAEMLGYDGGMTERVTAYSPGVGGAFGGSVTYNNDTNFPAGEFLLVYATSEGSAAGGVETHPVYSHRYQHFPEVPAATFGVTCGGSSINAGGRILRGSDTFRVGIAGGPASSLAALFLSFTSIPPTPAPFLLAPCRLNIGASFANTTLFTNAAGSASIGIPFPACPFLLTGTYHFQWLWLVPAGIGSTNGLTITIN